MAITKEQLHEYCKPLISRKNADLGFMRDSLIGIKADAFELARSFIRFEPDFEGRLGSAPPELSGPIREALNELGGARISPKTAVERLRGVFLKYGIFLESESDPGVWFVTRRLIVGQASLALMIGPYEKLKNDHDHLHNGRLHVSEDGSANDIRISVSGAAARVAELLDLWLSPVDGLDETEQNERLLYRLNDEGMRKWTLSNVTDPETMGLDFTLYVISMRATFARFRALLEACDSPREFLNEAINDQVEAVAVHETGHMEENRLNGLSRFGREKKEHLAYLLEAAYSHPAIAFRSLIGHGHDVSLSLPYLSAELKKLGNEAFLQGDDFLTKMAFDMLDMELGALHEGPHDEVLDLGTIRKLRNLEFVKGGQMETVEKAMFNPSWK
jgi:hypothetical protein